ncbi:MAG TPA: hypothetical protein VN812_00965, partial [Candidatus Acidoferrales bacterium]|nr:hypothetical protein [Candidatus Acidoferrales bacterium]
MQRGGHQPQQPRDRAVDTPAAANVTAGRYRLMRRVVRAVSVLALGKRKRMVEALLQRFAGDIVEGDGHVLHVHPRDQVIARRLRRRGIWSPAETALSKQLLRPGMIVLDIGANIGYFTLLFAR